MITALDSNVVIGLWNPDDALNRLAQAAMDSALTVGSLVISAPVFAELVPARTEGFVDYFLKESGIAVDWDIDEEIWRTAGRAFAQYAIRRRRQQLYGPRRILADFVIGAHALHREYRLLTLDDRVYRMAFPRLHLANV